MSDLGSSRSIIQTESVRFRSAVSEAIMQRLGGLANFLAKQVIIDMPFFGNGYFGTLVTPFLGVDGLNFFPKDAIITDVYMFIRNAGSAGQLEMDLKVATTPGGSFTSIFSTTPKINYLAGDDAWVYVGSSFPNTTAPVIANANVDQHNAIRCDILDKQTNMQNIGLIVKWRPR